MRAIGLMPTNQLEWIETKKPVPGPRDLLVRVQAVAVNPIDVKQSPPGAGQPPRILGYDAAGTVEAVGPEVSLSGVDDHVYYAGSIMRPGAFAEFHLVDERIAARKPQRLTFAEAAALPLTTITAWEGLFDRLSLPKSAAQGIILVVNAAGGVGSVAVQLARRSGLTVIGTASRPESRRWALSLGAHHVINHKEDFARQLKVLGINQVPYIFCLTDPDPHWDNMMQVLAPQGALCTIAAPSHVSLRPLFAKSAAMATESMFVRSRFETADMIEQHRLLDAVSGMVDAGLLKTTLTEEVSPISPKTLTALFSRIREGDTVGKLAASGFEPA